MFDNLFTMMGPVGSSVAIASVLVTVGTVIGLARCVTMRRLVRF
ncbi:hypothetical protein [Pendulispora brunnea]